MLFDVSLYHTELISIFEFNTFRNYAEVLLYTTVKIHTALGSASLSSGGLSRERWTKISTWWLFPCWSLFSSNCNAGHQRQRLYLFLFHQFIESLIKTTWTPESLKTLWQEWHTQLWALWKSTFFHLRLFLIFGWFLFQVCHKNQQTCPLWTTFPLIAYWLQLYLLMKGMLVPFIIKKQCCQASVTFYLSLLNFALLRI